MVYFPYEPYCKELGDLFADGLVLFFIEAMKLLGKRSSRQLDVLGVLGDFCWDPQHLRGLPDKDIIVGLEEVDDRAFLFVGEHYPNANVLGCVNIVDETSFMSSVDLKVPELALRASGVPWGTTFWSLVISFIAASIEASSLLACS